MLTARRSAPAPSKWTFPCNFTQRITPSSWTTRYSMEYGTGSIGRSAAFTASSTRITSSGWIISSALSYASSSPFAPKISLNRSSQNTCPLLRSNCHQPICAESSASRRCSANWVSAASEVARSVTSTPWVNTPVIVPPWSRIAWYTASMKRSSISPPGVRWIIARRFLPTNGSPVVYTRSSSGSNP